MNWNGWLNCKVVTAVTMGMSFVYHHIDMAVDPHQVRPWSLMKPWLCESYLLFKDKTKQKIN